MIDGGRGREVLDCGLLVWQNQGAASSSYVEKLSVLEIISTNSDAKISCYVSKLP